MAPALHLPPPSQGASDELGLVSTSTVDGSTFSSGGVVYPPPDLRAIVDKTAEFVARNGVAFEAKIREQERMNPKFAFLQQGDAYHAYFRLQIRAATEKQMNPDATETKDAGAAAAVHAALQADRSQRARPAEPERPPPHEFSLEFPSTAAVDMEILKLTALFTARQGHGFATRLLAKESESHQFAFLQPRHPLFSYFNLLVEQYRRVMQPSQALLDQVHTYASHRRGPGAGGARMQLLPAMKKRAAWTKWDQDRREEEEAEEERRKATFDEIDWQDFVVVGVVEITSNDARADLPPPRSLHELQTMVHTQEKMAEMQAAEKAQAEARAQAEAALATAAAEAPAPEAEEEEPTTSSESVTPSSEPARPAISKPIPQGPIKIRQDYRRTARPTQTASQTTVCPVCGDSVLLSEMSEHVRIELLNPKFREERAKIEQRRQEQASVAAGADPSHFLKQFAGARTDIFGAREDEEAQARRDTKERELAREKERHVWDGHANSSKAAQEARARKQAVSTDEQLAQLRQKPTSTATPLGPHIPGKRAAADEGATTAPAATKRRTESPSTAHEGALYPEQEWLAMYPHPITLHVHVPDAPHMAPLCDGRVLELSGLPLTTTIGQIRDRILNEALQRSVSASKLKMWVHGKPATLRQSLAYWNLADGAHVEMSLAK